MSRYVESFISRLNSDDELAEANKLISAKIAAQLVNGPVERPLAPAADHMTDYLLSLGYGDKPYEGLATGLDEFDHLIGGLNRFVLLAARAGTGKSTLAIQLGLGALQTAGTPMLFYSYEMQRRDVYTMMLQNLTRMADYHLTRKEIILHGNNAISTDSANAIKAASDVLQELGDRIWVIDATDGEPSTSHMAEDIERVRAETGSKEVLVIVDSIQDLVQVGSAGSTAAEAELAQHMVEIQQATNATILAISQKSKGGSFEDPYAGILGSVSMMHKPTAVVDLASVYDLIRQIKDGDAKRTYQKLAELSDVPNPVIATVLKGRNNGHGHVNLKFYGRYGYFEPGRIHDFDANTETSIYDLLGL